MRFALLMTMPLLCWVLLPAGCGKGGEEAADAAGGSGGAGLGGAPSSSTGATGSQNAVSGGSNGAGGGQQATLNSGGSPSAAGGSPAPGGATSGLGSTAGTGAIGGAVAGGAATGGVSVGSGGTQTGGTRGLVDCNATMPTSGAREHLATGAEGGSGNLAWQIWTNGAPGSLTTYDGVPAFRASWSESGDYLGRMGFDWGDAGKPFAELGTIEVEYVWNKAGTAGNYSYLGVYGWSDDACAEWYIIEDSFHEMPFNTGASPVDTAEIDGAAYQLARLHAGGGDRCAGAGNWVQYYSVRLEGSRCGVITVSDHFDAWAAQGWDLGSGLQGVKIVVEAAAGEGSVDLPVANVRVSQ